MRTVLAAAIAISCPACLITLDDGDPDRGDDTVPPPPPEVTSMSPSTGPFGAEVVIEGAHFGDAPSSSVAEIEIEIESPNSPYPSLVAPIEALEWTDTRIRFQFPFPASGLVTVRAAGGSVAAGSFEADGAWQPGPGFPAWGLIEARLLDTGAIAALFRYFESQPRATLVVFDGDASAAYPLEGLADPPLAALAEGQDGRVQVVATTALGELVHFNWVEDTFVGTPTGIHGDLLAGGNDDAGVYAWLRQEGGLSRVRADAGWTADRGPIATYALAGAVAADGTLVVAYGSPGGDFFDTEEYPAVAWMLPEETAFTRSERAETSSYDDRLASASLQLAADGERMFLTFSVQDDGNEYFPPPRMRAADASWQYEPALFVDPVPRDAIQFAFTDTGLAAAYAHERDDGIAISPDMTPGNEQVVAVWPAQPQVLLAVPDGSFRLIVSGNPGTSFAPTAGQ